MIRTELEQEHRANLIRDARFRLTDWHGRLGEPTWKPDVHLLGGWTDDGSTYEVNLSRGGHPRWYSLLTTRANGDQKSNKWMFSQDDYGVLVWHGTNVKYIGYLSDNAWLLFWTPWAHDWNMELLQAWELCKAQTDGSHKDGFLWTRPLYLDPCLELLLEEEAIEAVSPAWPPPPPPS